MVTADIRNQNEAEWLTTFLIKALEVDNSLQSLNDELLELIANCLALKQSWNILCEMKMSGFLAASHHPRKLRS